MVGIPRLSVVNVVGSAIARETKMGVYLNAGRETAVASTKAFTTQVRPSVVCYSVGCVSFRQLPPVIPHFLRDSVGCVSFRQLPHICTPYFYGIPPFLWHSVSFVVFRQFSGYCLSTFAVRFVGPVVIPSAVRHCVGYAPFRQNSVIFLLVFCQHVRHSVCQPGCHSVCCSSFRLLRVTPSVFRPFTLCQFSVSTFYVRFVRSGIIPSVARHSVGCVIPSVFRQYVRRSARQFGRHSACCVSLRLSYVSLHLSHG